MQCLQMTTFDSLEQSLVPVGIQQQKGLRIYVKDLYQKHDFGVIIIIKKRKSWKSSPRNQEGKQFVKLLYNHEYMKKKQEKTAKIFVY